MSSISKMNIVSYGIVNSISSVNYDSILSGSNSSVSNGCIVSNVSNGVSDISIVYVSKVSAVGNIIVRSVSSVSNFSIVCN